MDILSQRPKDELQKTTRLPNRITKYMRQTCQICMRKAEAP